MKIAFLTERMILGFGVDLVVDNVAQGLSELGHDVTVFAINVDETFKKRGYKIKKFSCPLIWNPLKQEYVAYKAMPFIKNIESEFDIFLFETFPFYFFPAFIKKPCIIVDHGVSASIGMDWKTKIRLNYSKITKDYFDFIFTDRIITVSNYLKNILPKYAREKTDVIYNGADHYLIKSNNSEILNFRKENNIKPDEKLLLYVGRLNNDKQPYKGVNDLIDIYKKVKIKNNKIKLLMVGFGNDEDKKTLEKESIVVYPNAPTEKMPTIFSSSDIYVTATKWEGFDLPLIEANSFGKPSICYDIGPHKEVITNNISGFIVKNQSDFVKNILNLCKDKDLYEKISNGALENSKKFLWKNMVLEYEKVIKKTILNSKKNKLNNNENDLVDLITLNFNGKKYLKPLFDSIKKQTYKKIKVTMVDNGSIDDSVSFVEKEYPWVNIIKNKKNLFFPKANNIAIKKTKGEYLFLLNNDTVLKEDAVEEMVKTIKKDSRTIAVAPKMMMYKNKNVFDAFGTVMIPNGSPFNRGIGQCDIGQYDTEEKLFGACFGAVLIKRHFYEKVVKPLDNDYFGYFEDVDWCYRAQGMGLNILSCPKSIVYHDHSGSSKNKSYEWKYFLIHRNYIRTLFKNYGTKHLIKYGSKKILSILKESIKSPSKERQKSCRKILIDTFFYMPKLIVKRLNVRNKRFDFMTDNYIWSFSDGEKPFFNGEKYEPDFSLENIKHSYLQKYSRIEKLNISKEEKEETLKMLTTLNDLSINYSIYTKKQRKNLTDLIEKNLINKIGLENTKLLSQKIKKL